MGESCPDLRGKGLLMDDILKKGIGGTLITSITLMTVASHMDCGSEELCQVTLPEQPHIEQGTTSGVSDTGGRPAYIAAATSSIGEQSFLRRANQPFVYFKK